MCRYMSVPWVRSSDFGSILIIVGLCGAGECVGVEGVQRLTSHSEAAVASTATDSTAFFIIIMWSAAAAAASITRAVPSAHHYSHVLARGDSHPTGRLHVAGAEAYRLL